MRNRLFVAIAVAAIVTAACGSSEGDDGSAATTAPTSAATTAPAATSAAGAASITADQALAVADAYFDAYNNGDAEAVMGLFDDAAGFSDNFGPQERPFWELVLAWNMGQGTSLEGVQCTPGAESGDSIVVTCELRNRDALVQAVDGPAVPVTQTLAVTAGGITSWEFIFGQPDFNAVWSPFRDWMTANHAGDINNVGFGNWSSTDDAMENGLLTAQYAAAWRSYLDEKGCAYDTGC